MRNFALLVCTIAILNACAPAPEQPADEASVPAREYYQLKTYTFDTDSQVAATEAYLEQALLPATKALGMGPVGVFKPRPNTEDTTRRLFVLMPFRSLEEFAVFEQSLAQDSSYLVRGAPYLNAPHDLPPYQRIESVLLLAFEDMPMMATPKLDGPREERVYELRSYESATEAIYRNKVDMFNAGGEVTLFDKLGFNAVFYGEVISGAHMPNLMYMTTHANQEARDANWKLFVEAPEWIALKSDPKYQHNVSHIDITFLYPTAYSAY
ncbi:MAG: NIPSNAP family protein [Bacteroidia bacterium]|nr:NIPSNAP family protein [Bacteroidia bacterium]